MQAFADKLVEVVTMDEDYVWVHDYHLLVLPSLTRKRFNRVRLGFFLHSPFPSSEIFRTFPRREEILRSLLCADLLGAPPTPVTTSAVPRAPCSLRARLLGRFYPAAQLAAGCSLDCCFCGDILPSVRVARCVSVYLQLPLQTHFTCAAS